MDAKGAAAPASPSGDTELPDFEAIVEAEILEAEQTPPNLGKPNKSGANKTVTVGAPAAGGAKKPSQKAPAEKKAAAKASTTVEERLDRTEAGKKPTKKPADDAFDELLSELD